MRLRYLLLLSLVVFGYINLDAQAESIQCDLANLYQITVSKNPTLQRQNIQTRIARVDKQSARSLFDYQLFSDLSMNRSGSNLFDADPRKTIVGNQIKSNNMSLSTGVQRTFRSSTRASVGVQYSRVSDNFPFNAFNEDIGAFVSDNSTNITLSVTQPLLRGRGHDIVTANERAADLGIERQEYNSDFISSGEVYSMTIGYWQYLGATKSLKVYQENEARVNQVLEVTTELVKGDKKPSSDLLQVQADLKDKERQTISAKQNLFTTQQNLGRAIGLNNIESKKIGIPLNDFPEVEQFLDPVELETLIEIAHENRTDLKALRKSLDALSIFIDVAENNTKPQLDVTAFLGYGGLASGNGVTRFLSALGEYQGRNYQAGLSLNYLFPINNNFAEANLLNRQLQYSDQQILIENQIRNIELNVNIAYNNFQNSIEALKKSKQSLEYYEEVFTNEQFKFQTGLTTLLNLILFQERLTFAQLDYIQNQQQFAIAISNLRYETGTIYSTDNLVSSIFYTLPKK